MSSNPILLSVAIPKNNYVSRDELRVHICFYPARFGRKTAVLVSSALHVGAAFGSAFAPNYGAFVAFRFLQGMSNMGIFMSLFVIGEISA